MGAGSFVAASNGVVNAEVATAAIAPTVRPTGLAATTEHVADAEAPEDLTLVGSEPRRTWPLSFSLSLAFCTRISSSKSQGQTFSVVFELL